MFVIPYVCMKGPEAIRSVAFQLTPICRLMLLEIRVILPSQGSKKECMNVQTFRFDPFNPFVTRSAFEGTFEHLETFDFGRDHPRQLDTSPPDMSHLVDGNK